MCEFCGNIIYSDTDIWKARNRGNDFIYKVDNEYGIYISTAEYCHPGILGNIKKNGTLVTGVVWKSSTTIALLQILR